MYQYTKSSTLPSPVYRLFFFFLHEVYPHWLYTLALCFNNMNVAIIVTHSVCEAMIAACA